MKFDEGAAIRELRARTGSCRTLSVGRRRVPGHRRKVLEDAGIELASITFKGLDVSSWAMPDALVAGATDPDLLAER